MTADPLVRMHSAEHLLNQTMVRMFGCQRCFSAHINKKKSKCDYRFDRMLTDGELREIETRVNQVIQEDLPVTLAFVSPKEAEESFNIERVPDGDELETFRIVHMGDYDACPCIGTHVSSTAEINGFRIISADFNDDVLRIRFKLS
jgi:alanyl-tRNA synthetase